MKEKKWWQHLISIPIVLLVDILMLALSLYLDGKLFANGNANGHGMPVLSLISVFVIIIITIITIVTSISKAIKSVRKDTDIEKTGIENKPKSIGSAFIPFGIILVISIIIVIISFKNEINSFYSNPGNIGFAVPMFSFMLTGILILINGVVLIISIIVACKRAGKQ